MSTKTKSIVQISMVVCIICICAWITIPFVLPFTMQSFAVFFSIGLLGGKKGFISISVYLLLGMIGLPVFSGFTGGLGILLGPTGGFLVGFLFCSLIYCLIEPLNNKLNFSKTIIEVCSFALCMMIYYLFGILGFALYSNLTDLLSILSVCFFPYVIPDIFKILLAITLCKRIKPYLNSY
ncbi:MAG: biotin transporter BioY [Clostridia bacterium]|nr:biotin transporter BioY [Clostridia bacterium]